VGRADELTDLEHALTAGPGVVVQAVHGLGGIGKSALAARYALLHEGEYTQVVWLSAEDSARIEASLVRFAIALEPQLGEVLSSDALAERAMAWLAARDQWLLILDNVGSVNDIAPLLARLGGGSRRFLATSRRATGWDRIGAAALQLGVFEPGEALALLAGILRTTPDDLDRGSELCEELGFLPLAISQAGAYMGQNHLGPRSYLQLLADYPAHQYATGDEDTVSERTIARIWHVTLDRLADDPFPGQVLRILAWYASEVIPRTLLDGLADPPTLLEAVGRLAAYSMLTTNADTIDIHRLVQAVTRTPDPGDPHRSPQAIEDARDQAIHQLAAAIPSRLNPSSTQDPGTWPRWRTLLPHIDALASHTSPATDPPDIISLFIQAGRFLRDQGQVARSVEYARRTLADCVRINGPDAPDTLSCRNDLAAAYIAAGDLGQAIPLLEQVVSDSIGVLGKRDPETLTYRHNLAGAYESAGDLDRAISMLKQVIADRQRVMGRDHGYTLTSRGSLAVAYESAGDLGRAIPLFEQLLADCIRVLGHDHRYTLVTRHSLAGAYESAGDLGRAILLSEHDLAESIRVLGEDHPETLSSLMRLADAYGSAGDLSRAIPLFEHVLVESIRVLGPEDYRTLRRRDRLAAAYELTGDPSQASHLLEQDLADYILVPGEEHPGILAYCNDLANTVPDRPWQTHWSHSWPTIGREESTGHTQPLSVAAGVLPDGTPVIVSGGDDRTVRVWRLVDGAPIGEPLRGHDGAVRAVAAGALPDGTPVIVSGSDDWTVRVWRLADGRPVGEPLRGHTGPVHAVAAGALPDGTTVIISSGGTPRMHTMRLVNGNPVIGSPDGTVRVWRLADGKPVGEPLRGHDGRPLSVAAGVLPDGTPVTVSGGDNPSVQVTWWKITLSGGGDPSVRVWRLVGGRPVGKPLRGHEGAVYAVAVGALPDGTPVIVSGSDDWTVRVWRLDNGRPVGEPLRGHEDAVRAVAVGALPDGTPVIFSGSDDWTVRVWRLADGTQLAPPLDLAESVQAVAVHGDLVVTAAGTDIAVHQPVIPQPPR
jgi:tetratricopeptide (TPR) repeat protein